MLMQINALDNAGYLSRLARRAKKWQGRERLGGARRVEGLSH